MNVFELFDGYWQENFSSAVLALVFQVSPHFRHHLLVLIRDAAPLGSGPPPDAHRSHTRARQSGGSREAAC